jgi:hypothetical protein
VTESWRNGPFTPLGLEVPAKVPGVRLTCPISDIEVAWAAKDAFNPGTVLHEGRVHILLRGEDRVARFGGRWGEMTAAQETT